MYKATINQWSQLSRCRSIGATAMVPPLDIFRLNKDGSLQWLQTADNLQAARLRIEVLALSAPGEYVIFSQKTGHKTVIAAGKQEN